MPLPADLGHQPTSRSLLCRPNVRVERAREEDEVARKPKYIYQKGELQKLTTRETE
jgi:hypothetical protein